jgi:hypothetical protein
MKNPLLYFIMVAALSGLSYRNPMPVTVTQNDLKYIATKIQDPECIIGVFKVPDAKDQWRKIKTTGDYPENDAGYREYVMEKRLLKMDVLKLEKGDADSVVFTTINLGGINEEEMLSFYPFPGVSWLLVLNKGLIYNSSKNEPAGWVKDVKNIEKYKWMNPLTVFVSDGYKGNYYIHWNNKYEIPVGLTETNMDFANDIGKIYGAVKNLGKDISKDDYNATINVALGKMKTENGKKLCDMLRKG